MEDEPIMSKNKSARSTYVIILIAVILLLLVFGVFLLNKKGGLGTSKATKNGVAANPTFESCYEKVTNVTCPNDIPCMTNPASSFCVCMGGVPKIKDTAGGQFGMCVINGQEIDEWEYFRNNTAAFQQQE